MDKLLSLQKPLYSILWPREEAKFLRHSLLVSTGCALLILCSKVNIPLQPVPITLQTLALFLIAMTYGWRLATGTLAIYFTMGLMGLPVFSGMMSGPAVFVGATGGYLIGWLPALLVASWLAERGWGKNPIGALLAQLLASVCIYVPGLLVLGFYVGADKAIALGLMPFILGDSLKMVFVALGTPVFWRRKK